MQTAPRERIASPRRELQTDSANGPEREGASARNLEPFLLLELRRSPTYGYELIRRLGDYGFRRALLQTTVIYQVLRRLEEAGAICSTWATQESGPARKYYELTTEGRDLLERRLQQLRRHVARVQRLLREDDTLGRREAEPVGPVEAEFPLTPPSLQMGEGNLVPERENG